MLAVAKEEPEDHEFEWEKMIGLLSVNTAKKIDMKSLKDLSKKLGVSVNDVLISSTTSALKQLFKQKGDKLGSMPDGKGKINLMIPTNARLQFYNTSKEVKMENKFTAIPLRIPLYSNMINAY